jgi:hypothetical protein
MEMLGIIQSCKAGPRADAGGAARADGLWPAQIVRRIFPGG